MKGLIRIGLIATIVVGLCATASVLPVAEAGSKKVETVSGVVRKAEVDVRGDVRRVYIDGNEENYLVVKRAAGKDLLAMVGTTVEAKGYIKKTYNDEDFALSLDVTEYSVLTESMTASAQK